MTTNYAQHVSTKQTPQSEPIPGSSQVANSAGGYSFAVDDWVRLDRFLILGSEGGSYYASERKLTKENAEAVVRCGNADPVRAVNRVVEISDSGRAPKNDPAIFALAVLASQVNNPELTRLALQAMPKVCRIGTHLFQFNEALEQMRGRGQAVNRAVRNWYLDKPVKDVAYQCMKYQSRNGWSHRDLLRLCKPKVHGTLNDVFHWVVKGWESVGDQPHPSDDLKGIWAFERAKRATDKREIVRLVTEYRLPRECAPTQWLNEADVWEALLPHMPLTAMVRNLAKMTAVGLIAPMSDAVRKVCDNLGSEAVLKKARMHPLAVLVAMNVYGQGHGDKGSLTWTPNQQVMDALNDAFYLAFQSIEPTGKNWMLAIDVSGSMGYSCIAGMAGVTPRVGAAAMAMATARSEKNYHTLAFSDVFRDLKVSPHMRLDDVTRITSSLPFSGTDCALPMLYATQYKIPVDVFAVYTDSETWFGSVHPVQALREYRQRMGRPAKLIVVGMVSNGFTIADPNDGGSLDVVGFDTAAPAVMADFAGD